MKPLRYAVSYMQRQVIDALKEIDGSVFINAPKLGGKSFCAAVAVSELASEKGGIWVRDGGTGLTFHVPPGTPWQEALPVKLPED